MNQIQKDIIAQLIDNDEKLWQDHPGINYIFLSLAHRTDYLVIENTGEIRYSFLTPNGAKSTEKIISIDEANKLIKQFLNPKFKVFR